MAEIKLTSIFFFVNMHDSSRALAFLFDCSLYMHEYTSSFKCLCDTGYISVLD